RGARAAGGDVGRVAGGVRGGDGGLGLGQVDVHEPGRVPGPADVGDVRAGRGGRLGAGQGRAGAGAQPADRLRVPGLQPAAAAERAGERDAADAVRRGAARGDGAAGGGGDGRRGAG